MKRDPAGREVMSITLFAPMIKWLGSVPTRHRKSRHMRAIAGSIRFCALILLIEMSTAIFSETNLRTSNFRAYDRSNVACLTTWLAVRRAYRTSDDQVNAIASRILFQIRPRFSHYAPFLCFQIARTYRCGTGAERAKKSDIFRIQ